MNVFGSVLSGADSKEIAEASSGAAAASLAPPSLPGGRRGGISLTPGAASEVFSMYADAEPEGPRHRRGQQGFSEPASSYVDTTPRLGHVVDDKRSTAVKAAAATRGPA